jgi:large subunit ribosomal protein L35
MARVCLITSGYTIDPSDYFSGDMNKPIYRYLADKKWRSYQYKIIDQRIQQLNIVPDVLPYFDPTADVRLAFGRHNVQSGEFVDSRVSEIPARLKLQVFDGGERLVSVIVVDTDVPLIDQDWFTSRAHYIACNIPVSPTQTSLPLGLVNKESQLVLPWLPPFAQKGSPYHRYSVFVLEQHPGQVFDVAALKEKTQRDAFHLRGFVDRHHVKPIGVGIFRAIWDEGTASVMERHSIEGADIEFKRKKIEALKPKQKARGWDAKHAGPKYSWLRK